MTGVQTCALPILEYGFLRLPKHHFDEVKLRWHRTESTWSAYARHVGRYRHRSLRHNSDILNAFMGIVTALYPGRNVYCGVPLSEIDLGLLWAPQPASSQEAQVSTVNAVLDPSIRLPSWTWASSASEIPNLHVEWDFRGSLCLWFRPVLNNASKFDLQPIIAASDAVTAFARPHDRAHIPVALAILYGLIGVSQIKESVTWDELTFDELHTVLRSKWPAYPNFWIETFGREEILSNARKELAEVLDISLSAGMLVTSTQVAKINVTGEDSSLLTLLNEQEHVIGYVVENNGQVRNLLQLGYKAFDCMALSVSNLSPFSPMFKTSSETLPENSFKDRDGNLLDPVPMVNIIVLRREKGYYLRIGIGKVYLKRWIELGAPFETVILA